MKKELFAFSFLTIILLVSVSAINFPSPQNKYINDFASVLNSGQQQELMNLFSSIDQSTTAEIVFVSVSDLQGYDISQYATELGQSWGVGKSDKDNGLVILYASDVKKIYVATGYGLEGILPDSKVGRILDENYIPARDSGNLSEGIVETGKALAQVVLDNKDEVMSGNATPKANYSLIGFIIGLALFVSIFMYLLSSRKKKKGFLDFWDFFFADFIARMIVGMLLGGRNRSGGGFSSGGGGGFGGGGFGGGGAGR